MDEISDRVDHGIDDGLKFFFFLLHLFLFLLIGFLELKLLETWVGLICFFFIFDCLANLIPFLAKHIKLIPH